MRKLAAIVGSLALLCPVVCGCSGGGSGQPTVEEQEQYEKEYKKQWEQQQAQSPYGEAGYPGAKPTQQPAAKP